MEPAITKDGTFYWVNDKGNVHREDGPAILYPDGLEVYVIDGSEIHHTQQYIAKGILDGSLFDQIPLYINHKYLKYFCQTALRKGPP